jgi:pyrroloquinoline quinone (PQQ) biosynthesis protein C
MGFFETLSRETRDDQQELLDLPFVTAALRGAISREAYLAFLGEAYHHVRHTLPLLMATGARLADDKPWLADAMCDYIAEERGHERWILADIDAAGGDSRAVRDGRPGLACELMVAYAWDTVQRRSPLGFFGMVHVLEGTSVRGATQAAASIERELGLSPRATTYLRSHGELDQDHVGFCAGLMDRLEDPREQEIVLHAAHAFFELYGAIFRGLPVGNVAVGNVAGRADLARGGAR